MSNFVKLILSILICQLAGIIGSLFVSDSISTWYEALNKPSFTPPNSIFAPVWIFLFLLMGIALFLVWREDLKNKKVKTAVTIFMVQLIFNVLWSVIFFGVHSILGGLVVIIILLVLIFLSFLKFFNISRISGLMLIPYLIWTLYAALLNYFIFILN